MADKQDRWLDRETAERLLRGGSPENAVAPEARDQAERLARTLGALSALGAEPLPADEELPGEAAALKAFSEARAARESHGSRQSPRSHESVYRGDAGLVRIGGRTGGDRNGERAHGRWSRPLRLGLAAALAVGMLGGVAVAAGTGVLRSPFDGAEPAPGASVSSAASPEHAPVSPSPDAPGGGPDAVAPDGGTDPDTGKGEKGTDGASTAPGARGTWPKGVTSSCRDIRAGRTLDTRHRRTLEGLAGGWSHVTSYCAYVLEGVSRPNTDGDDRDDTDPRGPWGDGGSTDGGTGRNGPGGDTTGLSSGQNAGPAGTGDDRDGYSGGTGSDDGGGTRGNGHGHGNGNGGNGGGRAGGTGHH